MALPLMSRSVSDGRRHRGAKEEEERELELMCSVCKCGRRERPSPREEMAHEERDKN
jgi:hypothetical protein